MPRVDSLLSDKMTLEGAFTPVFRPLCVFKCPNVRERGRLLARGDEGIWYGCLVVGSNDRKVFEARGIEIFKKIGSMMNVGAGNGRAQREMKWSRVDSKKGLCTRYQCPE